MDRLRRIALYGAAHGVADGLYGARGLLLARFLGPEGFGVWALMRLAIQYGGFALLGVNRGLERSVSRPEGETDDADLADVESSARTALGFNLLSTGVLALAALAVSFFVDDGHLALGLRAFSAGITTECVVVYALTYLRGRRDLQAYASLEVSNAALHLACAVALAILWGLAGAFAGFALASFVNAVFLLARTPRRPALSYARLRELVRVGFPIALTYFLALGLHTADQFVVTAFGGTVLLGYYAFAKSVASLPASFGIVVRTVIFPDVYGQASSRGHIAAVRAHLDRTLLPYAWLYVPLLGALALAIAPVVALAAPQYGPAVAPARLFVFTGATLGYANLAVLGVIAADRQRALPALAACAVLVNLALSALALHAGMGLEGAAAASLISQG
ncbi:MAG: lipopolysaccharide biosynthesis protein, partial [Gemmatimonadota bacterium]